MNRKWKATTRFRDKSTGEEWELGQNGEYSETIQDGDDVVGAITPTILGHLRSDVEIIETEVEW